MDDAKRERRKQMKYLTDVLIEDSTDGIDAVLELMERLSDSQKPYLTKAERRLLRQWCYGTHEHHARVANMLKDYWTLFVRMEQIAGYQKEIIASNEKIIKLQERAIRALQDRLGDTE